MNNNHIRILYKLVITIIKIKMSNILNMRNKHKKPVVMGVKHFR